MNREANTALPMWWRLPERRCSLILKPVIERKFHNYINCIEGVYHTGQRDMFRIRISIDAYNAGFRAKHFGEVLYAQVKNEFDAVVDKCAVTIYTDPAECTRIRHEVAVPTFDKRDERLDNLTDESVDVYYSCILCRHSPQVMYVW